MTAALDIDDVLRAYSYGLFPMAESAQDPEIHWYDPPMRCQLPLENLHVPRRLRETALKMPFEIRVDSDFAGVVAGCAEATPKRPGTWINEGIRDLFVRLYEAGHAHSVECWKDGLLVGGVYGLALGGAFSGESMFSRKPNASKIALIHLCARLRRGGFTILDAQFTNPHLLQFGAYEIPRSEYLSRLHRALAKKVNFQLAGVPEESLLREYLNALPRSLP